METNISVLRFELLSQCWTKDFATCACEGDVVFEIGVYRAEAPAGSRRYGC